MLRMLLLIVAGLVPVAAIPSLSLADEIRVVSSGGFATALRELGPQFEKATGHTLISAWGPSMGATVDAVPQRMARHEPIDLVVMVGYALGKMVDAGVVGPGDHLDLARSLIGMVVKVGAPRPDITTLDGLKRTLLAAKSVAYSDSASGVYIENELYKKMGIEAEMKPKSRMIPAEPVGQVVARGEAELGFQQISELKAVAGLDLVGPLPEGAQQITVFSGGVLTAALHRDAARALLKFLASPAAADAVRRSGMEPVTASGN